MRQTTTTRLAVLSLVFFALAGCGKTGPPRPPHIRIADQTRDLVVFQRAGMAVLEWSYPSMTTAGGPLPDVETVELWRVSLPRGQEPTGTAKRDRDAKVQLLQSQGALLREFDREGLEKATRGPKLHFEDDLAGWAAEIEKAQDWVVWYAVRTVCCEGRPSAFSNIGRLIFEAPPEAPPSFTAEGSRDGITLVWPVAEDITVQVERSGDGETWQTVTATPIAEGEWQDSKAAQGETWVYRLRSVRKGAAGVPVLSPPSVPVSVDHPDVYPPAPPTDLVCLPEDARVRLRWTAPAKDLVFRIERRVAGGDFVVLATAVPEVEYEDLSPPFGALVYAVRAVDGAGNSSDPISCETLIGAVP